MDCVVEMVRKFPLKNSLKLCHLERANLSASLADAALEIDSAHGPTNHYLDEETVLLESAMP